MTVSGLNTSLGLFTISNDGTLRTQRDLESYIVNGNKTESPVEHFVQGDNADISLVNSADTFSHFDTNRITWGNAHMTEKGLESQNVFVCLNGSIMSQSGVSLLQVLHVQQERNRQCQQKRPQRSGRRRRRLEAL